MNNFTIVRNPKSGTIAWSEDQMKYIISEYIVTGKQIGRAHV